MQNQIWVAYSYIMIVASLQKLLCRHAWLLGNVADFSNLNLFSDIWHYN